MLHMCVPYVGKMKTIHKIKNPTDHFFSHAGLILGSLEESPYGIYYSVPFLWSIRVN